MNIFLAGVIFVYNGEKFDYCYLEAIRCLLEFTDHVFIVAGGRDNTYESVLNEFNEKENVTIIYLSDELWDLQTGKEKLNFFTNIGIEAAQRAGYEYQFNLQADEIVHEKSYDAIRKAIDTGQDGFMNKRINLWQSPYLQLNVPQYRLPCSENIVRLAKTNYRSIGDAESIGVDNISDMFLNEIIIYHMGFVRKRDIMKQKVIHIQEEVFGVDHDKKLDGTDVFEPERWFSKNDLKPIDEPLPKIVQQWAKERHYE